MTLISKTTSSLRTVAVLFVLLFPLGVWAQDNSLTLSVSPTLFEMTANPGQEWVSSVRVINSNPYDITVYTEVMNFVPQGETGQAKFLPIVPEEDNGQTLAEWVHLPGDEITIPAEQTKTVPIKIKVPDNASPGGHFAAILVGTKSLQDKAQKTAVETSQVVTSLIFLRVTGDIIEDGVIREFRPTSYLTERPQMTFELRFQNKGNVHILPQGEIKIFNMWGQERGVIPVNRQTLFGNVLPDSIRKYSFTWSGEWSLADIGLYHAEATLAYGLDQRQFASSETSFWVLPWKIVLVVLLLLIGFVMFITWAIKLYIRKMLSMAGVASGTVPPLQERQRPIRKVSVVAPIGEGILDLRQRFQDSASLRERLADLWVFIRKYYIFFSAVVLVVIFIVLLIWYVRSVSVNDRPYEVTVEGVNSDVTISSEQVKYESLKEKNPVANPAELKPDFPAIKIVNQSGVSGLAAQLRVRLETLGYPVTQVTSDLGAVEENTVIVYAPEYSKEALQLSRDVYGALLSAYADASGTDIPITIYVGKDLENAVQ